MFTAFKFILSITLVLTFGTLNAEIQKSESQDEEIQGSKQYSSPDTIEGSIKISAEALIEMAGNNDQLVIIDSRMSSDRRQGYIAGSVSMPDTETSCASLFSAVDNKNSSVVFYCNGPKCRRSDRAVTIAVGCGYKNVFWFRGGIEEWKNKNYLISK